MDTGVVAPVVPNYTDAYNSLGSVYDPQVAAVQATEAPAMSALDQAKVNAFSTIGQQANAKGMTFSGFTPDQEATYTGTKYLPAVANLQAGITNAVNKLNTARSTQAQSLVSTAQTAANDAAYKNDQLALQQEKLNQPSASTLITPYQQAQLNNTQTSQQLAAMKAYTVTQKANNAGYAITGPSGQPVSLANYSQATGQSLLNLLGNSQSAYDRNAYNYAVAAGTKGQSEDQILNYLQKNYSKIF
jgi:hypothetical protein